MEWVRTADLETYDIFKAFDEFETIYWKKSNFNILSGDIVYFYVGKPKSRIMFKTVCVNNECSSTDENAKGCMQYWKGNNVPKETFKCVEVKLLKLADDERLSIEMLRDKNFIRGNIQGAIKSSNNSKLFEYLSETFDEIDK